MKIILRKRYFTIFLLVLVTEIAIAIFSFHRFIRGFLGDVLVLPLLYFFLRTFFPFTPLKTLMGVLAFAFFVEILQFFELSKHLEIDNGILQTMLGATFDPWDLIAYSIGGIACFLADRN